MALRETSLERDGVVVASFGGVTTPWSALTELGGLSPAEAKRHCTGRATWTSRRSATRCSAS